MFLQEVQKGSDSNEFLLKNTFYTTALSWGGGEHPTTSA